MSKIKTQISYLLADCCYVRSACTKELSLLNCGSPHAFKSISYWIFNCVAEQGEVEIVVRSFLCSPYVAASSVGSRTGSGLNLEITRGNKHLEIEATQYFKSQWESSATNDADHVCKRLQCIIAMRALRFGSVRPLGRNEKFMRQIPLTVMQ
jgi:hypothetical protein